MAFAGGVVRRTIRTGKGEQRKVGVASDVSLELNTQTSITLQSVPGETRIELISGEASATKCVVAQAAGDAGWRRPASPCCKASFNARCLDGTVSVTCLDGIVTVEQGHNTVRPHKSEQVTYSRSGLQASGAAGRCNAGCGVADGVADFRDRPLAKCGRRELTAIGRGRSSLPMPELSAAWSMARFQLDKLENFTAPGRAAVFGARITSLPGGVVL